MKKAVSLILALTLCLALAIPVMADYELTDERFGTSFTLTVDKTPLDESSDIYPPYYEVEADSVFTLTHTDESTMTFLNAYVTLASGVSCYLNPATAEFEQVSGTPDSGTYNLAKGQSVSFRLPFNLFDDGFVRIFVERGNADGSRSYQFNLSAASAQTTTPAATEQPATTTPATTAPETTAPATAVPAATPAGSGDYTAQKYDTYGKLAVNYYGSYAYTKALQKANNYKTLKEGAAVVLPDTLGKAARLAPATAGAGETLYTVLAGDTLGTIAKAYYGNSAQYKAIFERNADRLKNANTIYEGQIIVLPAK